MDNDIFRMITKYLQTLTYPLGTDTTMKQTIQKMYPNYFRKHNQLYHRSSGKRVLNKTQAEKAIEQYHHHPMGGHFAFKNTYQKIAEKYYWPNMRRDIKEAIDTCNRCQVLGKEQVRESLHPIPVPVKPFDLISMDVKHVSSSRANHKYIIVAIDYFTKWVEARPLVLANSLEISLFFYEEIITRHGVPSTVITDNGSVFVNQIIDVICNVYFIKHLRSSPYHPEGNGLVERFNRTLGKGLQMLPQDEKGDWHLYLSSFLFAYRSIVQASTKNTPFYLVYGRVPRTQFDNEVDYETQLSVPKDQEEFDLMIHQRFQQIIKQKSLVYKKAAEYIVTAQKQQQRQIQKRIESENIKDKPPFMLGEMVLRYRSEIQNDLSQKMEDKYDGPYIIHQCYNNSTYRLKTPQGKIFDQVTHGNKLKIYKNPKIFPLFSNNLTSNHDGSRNTRLIESTVSRHNLGGTSKAVNQFRYYKPPPPA